VLAYFVSTARVNRFADELLGSRLDYVELREEKGLVLAHVGRAQRVLDLTKDEVDKILDGWPPFYRKTFMSIEGRAGEPAEELRSGPAAWVDRGDRAVHSAADGRVRRPDGRASEDAVRVRDPAGHEGAAGPISGGVGRKCGCQEGDRECGENGEARAE
jgi:hypothetical protein